MSLRCLMSEAESRELISAASQGITLDLETPDMSKEEMALACSKTQTKDHNKPVLFSLLQDGQPSKYQEFSASNITGQPEAISLEIPSTSREDSCLNQLQDGADCLGMIDPESIKSCDNEDTSDSINQIDQIDNNNVTLTLGSIDQKLYKNLLEANTEGMQLVVDQNGVLQLQSYPQAIDDTLSNLEDGPTMNCLNSSRQVVDMVPTDEVDLMDLMSLANMPDLPFDCPPWARRLRNCEKIGDAFRGWVENGTVLEMLLSYHKRYSGCHFGTRQSPNSSKNSTRLMWKSQYVPFDGIPFVNTGSRATVMECEFGPRRKGAPGKKGLDQRRDEHRPFRQTCPARIYVKKVRKFPHAAVDSKLDKKTLKIEMDKAFNSLRSEASKNGTVPAQERIYVQLPTLAAHEFHVPGDDSSPPRDHEAGIPRAPAGPSDRLHPQVKEKIRDLVRRGVTELYRIRKHLRNFVDKELFNGEITVERHNLTYYPTVNDLQNNIHQAKLDLAEGIIHPKSPLPDDDLGHSHTTTVTTTHLDQSMNFIAPNGSGSLGIEGLGNAPVGEEKQYVADIAIDSNAIEWDPARPHPETVTVTVTQSPEDDGYHVISRVETHLSDGTTEVRSSFTPEMIELLSKLHPQMFSGGTLMSTDSSGGGGDMTLIPHGQLGDNSDPLIEIPSSVHGGHAIVKPEADGDDVTINELSTHDPEMGSIGSYSNDGSVVTVSLGDLNGAVLTDEGSVTLQAIQVEDNLIDLHAITDDDTTSKVDSMSVF